MAQKRHIVKPPLWELLQLLHALLGDFHIVGGEDVDDVLERLKYVVV